MKNPQKAWGLRDDLIGFSLPLAQFLPGRLFSETLNVISHGEALDGIPELNHISSMRLSKVLDGLHSTSGTQ